MRASPRWTSSKRPKDTRSSRDCICAQRRRPGSPVQASLALSYSLSLAGNLLYTPQQGVP
eukprot:3515695-Amphidinium_carterae.1